MTRTIGRWATVAAVDWVRWHEAYEEGGRLERRLACVQERIRELLDGARPGRSGS